MTDISTNLEQNMFMKNFSKTDDIVKDMRKIIETSRDTAYRAVNTILLLNCQKRLLLSMEKDSQKRTYIISIRFTERIQRFSTH